MVISYLVDKNRKTLEAFETKDGKPINTMLVDGICFYREYIQTIEAATCAHGTYTYETAADKVNKEYKTPDGNIAKYQYKTEANDKGEHNFVYRQAGSYGRSESHTPWCDTYTEYYYCNVCGGSLGKQLKAEGNGQVKFDYSEPNHYHYVCTGSGTWK